MKQKEKKFVIQEHTNPEGVHWDFMLELGQCLQTYRLQIAPEDMLKKQTAGERIPDHPLKFLTYQGPVNNGTGTVSIAEQGTCRIISQDQGRIELSLKGKILNGNCTLTQIKENKWLFSTLEQ